MKKTMRIFGLMLFAVTMCMNFVACSNGESNENPDSTSASLYGKWYFERMDIEQSMSDDLTDMATSFTEWIEFNTNGTVQFYDNELQQTVNGMFILDNKTITIYGLDSEDYMSYYYTIESLTDKKLVLHVNIEGILSATIYLKR